MSDAVAAPVVPANAETTAPESAPTDAAVKAPEQERTFTITVDGKTRELTETQARTEIQKSHAADKRMQAAVEAQKKVDAILKDFDADPEAALAKLGKDPAKLIAEHLARRAKLELMSPEQRDAEALRKERDEYKLKVEAHEKEKTEAANKAVDERNFEAVQTQLVDAANRYGLDATPETLEGLADVACDLIDYLGKAPTVDQIAQEYQRREREHIEARDLKVFSKLEGKKLLEYLGETGLAKVKAALAAADAETLKATPAPIKPTKNGAPKAHVRESKGHLREVDFDKKFGI